MAESGSLENCCPGNGTVGSIPTLSAKPSLLVPLTLPSRSADKTRNFCFRSFQPSLLVPMPSRARLSCSFGLSSLFGSKNEKNKRTR